MSFVKLMHQVLDTQREHYSGKPRFKPSALGTPCLRKLYYSYHRVIPDYGVSRQLRQYAEIGNYTHEKLSAFVRKTGNLIDYYNEDGSDQIKFGSINKEFPLKDEELEISAMIDAIAIIDGNLIMGEWKTIGNIPFQKLMAPKPPHLVQGIMYLYLFNKALREGVYSHIKELKDVNKVHSMHWVYENRDNGNLKEFHHTSNIIVFRQTIEKMNIVKEHSKNGTCPPKTLDWCKSCEWRDKCASNFVVSK